jgi:hypothetical protein
VTLLLPGTRSDCKPLRILLDLSRCWPARMKSPPPCACSPGCWPPIPGRSIGCWLMLSMPPPRTSAFVPPQPGLGAAPRDLPPPLTGARSTPLFSNRRPPPGIGVRPGPEVCRSAPDPAHRRRFPVLPSPPEAALIALTAASPRADWACRSPATLDAESLVR